MPALFVSACGGHAHERPSLSLVLPDVVSYSASEQMALHDELEANGCFSGKCPQTIKWLGEYIAMRLETRIAERALDKAKTFNDF